MATFNEKESYDFDYIGLDEDENGEVYIMLKYDGRTTLPGFGMLEYRVKALPFQITMPPEKFPRKIRCFVNKLISSRFNPAQEEQFPFLQQDREWLLRQVYVPGFTYKFSVTGRDFAGKYTLKDLDSGVDHYHYESATPLNIGDSFECVVQSINGMYLALAENRFEALRGAGFKVGRKLMFTIRKQKLDEQNRPFLQLADQFRGFWHRFYLEEDDTAPEQDDIELEIGDITPEGWLCLQYPGKRLADIQKIRLAENPDFGREDDRREFKTSIAFPPGESRTPDFQKQLNHNIMRVIVGFMNSNGGQLFIGVDDTGVVSGIEGDLPWLNQDPKDKFNGQYTCTTDGYELKINNAISNELGELAAALVSTRFFKVKVDSERKDEKVFCELTVKPASSPVYLHGTLLIVRAGNSCRQLRHGDITAFVLVRMRQQQLGQIESVETTATAAAETSPPATPQPAPPLKLAGDSSVAEISGYVPLIATPEKPEVNWGHLSFFADGGWQFGKPTQDSDKIADVQLTQRHRQSKYRLLQCYANGNVNAVGSLAKKTPKTKNKRYKNGWNTADQLMQVFACHLDDYLVIRSVDPDGVPRLKAIQVNEISVHDSLTAQGNTIVPESEAKVTEYQIVSERYSSFIYDIIAKGRYSGPGHNASLIRFQDCVAFLEQQKKNRAVGAE
ncbi:MAG TPA: ATP-binding protein [Lentisphaeria bacterium]|nr:ATP-binding protein [Lentisphaeria bacterium]